MSQVHARLKTHLNITASFVNLQTLPSQLELEELPMSLARLTLNKKTLLDDKRKNRSTRIYILA